SVDLPGHGSSPPPVGARYGDLTVEDYAAALLGTLGRLQDAGVRTTTLTGHSMGGATVLLAQQRLFDDGKSLHEAYGVNHAVLLAPGAWPPGVSCASCQSPLIGALFAEFKVDDPVLGTLFDLPPPVLLAAAWTTPEGTLAPDAPTAAEIA